MIRVLRLIEYTYPDARVMELDMGRWTVQTAKHIPNGTVIRSATLPHDASSFALPRIEENFLTLRNQVRELIGRFDQEPYHLTPDTDNAVSALEQLLLKWDTHGPEA